MRLPPVQPRSRRAHEAAQWARAQNHFDDYNATLFRALFERGEDIGEIDVLLNLAEVLQLDATALRATLESRDLEPSVLADEREAESIGVSGVPAFVANRRVVLSGVQSLAGLQELVAQARSMK